MGSRPSCRTAVDTTQSCCCVPRNTHTHKHKLTNSSPHSQCRCNCSTTRQPTSNEMIATSRMSNTNTQCVTNQPCQIVVTPQTCQLNPAACLPHTKAPVQDSWHQTAQEYQSSCTARPSGSFGKSWACEPASGRLPRDSATHVYMYVSIARCDLWPFPDCLLWLLCRGEALWGALRHLHNTYTHPPISGWLAGCTHAHATKQTNRKGLSKNSNHNGIAAACADCRPHPSTHKCRLPH